MEKINALGKLCPQPVIEAKKYISSNPELSFQIDVDNQEAVDNLKELADKFHYTVDVESYTSTIDQPRSAMSQSTSYKLLFKPENTSSNTLTIDTNANLNRETFPININASSDNHDFIVVISSDQMGTGDEDFGRDLLKNFIYALSESEKLPQAIIFYNKGVFLPAGKDEKLLSDLFSLAEAGVEIYSCGLCLNYYKLSEELKIGNVTNMFRIVELMSQYRVVKP